MTVLNVFATPDGVQAVEIGRTDGWMFLTGLYIRVTKAYTVTCQWFCAVMSSSTTQKYRNNFLERALTSMETFKISVQTHPLETMVNECSTYCK